MNNGKLLTNALFQFEKKTSLKPESVLKFLVTAADASSCVIALVYLFAFEVRILFMICVYSRRPAALFALLFFLRFLRRK